MSLRTNGRIIAAGDVWYNPRMTTIPPLGQLHPIPPYDFALTLDIVRRYAFPAVDHVRGMAYIRALRVDDVPVLVHVTAGADGALDVYRLAGRPVDESRLLARVAQVLGTGLDLSRFAALVRADERLHGVVGGLVGARMLRAASMFEALATTIIEQQIAWTAAQRAQQWLVRWGGDALQHAGETFHTFPRPETVAAADVETLTPLKITFRRMRLLIDIAGQIADGRLDLESLRHASPADAYAALMAIKGIGHWTATYTLTRTFGPLHPYVGDNDVALQAAVNEYFYGGEGRIPPEQVRATFAPYGDFAGAAALYTLLRRVREKYGD